MTHALTASMIVTFMFGPSGVCRTVRIKSDCPCPDRDPGAAARVDFQRAEGLDQPVGIDGDHLPRPARGELIVAAEIDRRRLVALDPEPEELIVAAQIDLRPGQAGSALRRKLRGR